MLVTSIISFSPFVLDFVSFLKVIEGLDCMGKDNNYVTSLRRNYTPTIIMLCD